MYVYDHCEVNAMMFALFHEPVPMLVALGIFFHLANTSTNIDSKEKESVDFIVFEIGHVDIPDITVQLLME